MRSVLVFISFYADIIIFGKDALLESTKKESENENVEFTLKSAKKESTPALS